MLNEARPPFAGLRTLPLLDASLVILQTRCEVIDSELSFVTVLV